MIIILTGLTCAGKDTAQDYLHTKGWGFIVSTTSRPKRVNEIEGKNYYYVTREEFQHKIENNEMLEHRKYNTLVDGIPDIWYYGVETCHVDPSKNLVAVLDNVGYEAFVSKFGRENIKLVWIDTDDELRKERNIARLDYNESEFVRRNIADTANFAYLKNEANFIINNSDTFERFYSYLDLMLSQLKESNNIL